jgi:hypothetical protein
MCALLATTAAGLLLNHAGSLHAQQSSEGQPHKWEAVTNKSMYDFVADGFELKSVAYDTSVLGPQKRFARCPLLSAEGCRFGEMRFPEARSNLILLAL